jgi:hypothetical protein
VAVLGLCVWLAPAIAFGQWSERTTLTFSDPVMVPGATLQPGNYVFQLVDPGSAGDAIEIRKEDGSLVTTTITVPTKRMEAKGDTVLKFNPTEPGAPPALAAWFYPGSIYGHQFVYSDEEASAIAQRTKSVVLSTDMKGTDREKATLRIYDASGVAKQWKPDSDAMASWQQWSRNRAGTATLMTEKADGDRARSVAPMVDAKFEGTRVKVGDLEENARQYMGKTVSVDAEVEEVLGPRLFTIDERNWGDLDGELLVLVETPLAAVVRDEDLITVSGVVKPFLEVNVDKEWGWLGMDKNLEVEFRNRPVLIASKIVGGNNSAAFIVNPQGASARAVGTSGSGDTGSAPSAKAIVTGDDSMVGRSVAVNGVAVHALAKDRGFFAKVGDDLVFVLPMANAGLTQGQTVSIEGITMAMPRHMRDHLNAPAAGNVNEDVYIYATRVDAGR